MRHELLITYMSRLQRKALRSVDPYTSNQEFYLRGILREYVFTVKRVIRRLQKKQNVIRWILFTIWEAKNKPTNKLQ